MNDIFNFPKLKNDLILRVIAGEKVERTPIWIMRQAGRYLPEFREMKETFKFWEMVQTPEICAEITIMPIKRYGFDAAIIFSDILIVCQAMGMPVQMIPGKGPVFDSPLKTPQDLKNLKLNINTHSDFGYLLDGLKFTRSKLAGMAPLIGFCGAPWTLMCYMTDTSENGAKNYSSSRKWLYAYSDDAKFLLDQLSVIISDLLVEQAKSGAQILMLFESHGELLNRALFKEFEWPCIAKICTLLKSKGITCPFIYYIKGGHYIIDDLMKESCFDVIGVDWTIDPRTIGHGAKTLMGNMDPAVLYGSKDEIEKCAGEVVKSFEGRRHIFNLGHGIYPDIEPESVGHLVNYLRK